MLTKHVVMIDRFNTILDELLRTGTEVDHHHVNHISGLAYIATTKGIKHYAYIPHEIKSVGVGNLWVEITPGKYDELKRMKFRWLG